MNARLPTGLRRTLRRLGWPGALGAAGLALCLLLLGTSLLPARQRLAELRERTAALQAQQAMATGTPQARVRPLDEQFAAFQRLFPSEQEAPDAIGRLDALARRHGLRLQQAEYQVDRDRTLQLTRWQISLPLKGSYPAIRRFLVDLRAELPSLALEQVQFQRQKVGDPQVDAQLRLILFLRQAS